MTRRGPGLASGERRRGGGRLPGAMKVHHVACATMCPAGFRWLGVDPPHMVCHVLVLETPSGLVLVDTGFGTRDVAEPTRLGRPFLAMVRPRLRREDTALAHVQALGYAAGDVRAILPTHLDLDHAGGLSDFPEASVHVHAPEVEAALAPTLRERLRYRRVHFEHGPRWERHRTGGERWRGFECVRSLPGLPPELLVVPTVGHTRGHAAIAIDLGDRVLVHAGDAYFHREEMRQPPSCPAPLQHFQRLMAVNDGARRHNQARLRELAQQPGVTIFCAHDPVELERLRR